MTEQEKKIAALSYVPLLSVICLLGRNEAFVRFHVSQALVVHVFIFIWIFLPLWWLTVILELGSFALLIMGFYYAASGHMYELPLVKELLRKKTSIDNK